ncbi:leucyl aminopeptidase, partial [Escherichia coli]|nr:leucyl aminopeptidase [Escherichia coli]
ILGVLKNGDKVSIAASPFAADTTTSLEQSLSALGVAGKADEITALPGVDGTKAKVLQFIGLGVDELADLTEEKLRRAAGSAARQLSNAKSAIFALPADSVERVAAVAEGIALGSYRYENHRSKKSEKPV